MPKDFTPPRQVETHAYIFDRKTGEILATHTRVVDAGAEGVTEGVSTELLASIAKDSDRAAKDLDVVQARPRAARGVLRVDVKTRKVMVDRSRKQEGVLMAPALPRP